MRHDRPEKWLPTPNPACSPAEKGSTGSLPPIWLDPTIDFAGAFPSSRLPVIPLTSRPTPIELDRGTIRIHLSGTRASSIAEGAGHGSA